MKTKYPVIKSVRGLVRAWPFLDIQANINASLFKLDRLPVSKTSNLHSLQPCIGAKHCYCLQEV